MLICNVKGFFDRNFIFLVLVFYFSYRFLNYEYWNLSGEVLPLDELNVTTGELVVVTKGRGFLGVNYALNNENGYICCFRQYWGGGFSINEGKEADIYWQSSSNMFSRLFDQKYVMKIDVRDDNGLIYSKPLEYEYAKKKYGGDEDSILVGSFFNVSGVLLFVLIIVVKEFNIYKRS